MNGGLDKLSLDNHSSLKKAIYRHGCVAVLSLSALYNSSCDAVNITLFLS